MYEIFFKNKICGNMGKFKKEIEQVFSKITPN